MSSAKIRFKFRRDISSDWVSKNPILLPGEPGLEKDTGRIKIGDGVTRFLDLPYYPDSSEIRALIEQAISDISPGEPVDLSAHINSPLPHPVYDDGPSFLLLYQNAKV